MSVWPLPRITFQDLSAVHETRPVALLTSDDVWAVLGTQLALPVMIQAEPVTYSRTLFDYLADHLPSQVQAVYAVGQGAPVEAAKVIAARNNKPLVVVPTALDSSRMLTPTALIEEESEAGKRFVAIDASPAAEIILDWSVIQAAPDEQCGAGIADVVAIVTALLDWRYAAQKGKNPVDQRFAPWAASVAAGLASQAIKTAAAIGQGNREALHTLLDLMMVAVQLGNQLGHRRVCEGSEHYLALALASHSGISPHYELVAPFILLASVLHGQDPAPLQEALSSAGVRLDQLRATDVRLMLDELPNLIGAYGFPYSILNDLDPASETVTKALEAAGLQLEDQTWQLPEATQPVVVQAVEEPQPVAAEEPASEQPAGDQTQPAADILSEEAPVEEAPAEPSAAVVVELPADLQGPATAAASAVEDMSTGSEESGAPDESAEPENG
jgi:glycerol dehydrogenase-like iron-containing ADH family enzyme